MSTPHYDRVKEFCRLAGQETPETITIPDAATRILRAKLILEEALETVEALGIKVYAGTASETPLDHDTFRYEATGEVDVEMVADGCADISVVTVGTLIAFGIDDEALLAEVDAANLRKFGPGGYRRDDGKWVKPPDWVAPDVVGAIGLR